MNGTKAILDSNVIIFASKQKIDIDKLLNQFDSFHVSIIAYMEVYSYEFEDDKERKLIDDLFESIEIIDVNIEIAEQAINYRKNKIRKIKLPDAIILATTKYLEADLITDDWDDFEGIDNNIEIIKVDSFRI